MRYILLNIIIFISLFSISLSAKISKKTALWQGEAIVEEQTMLNAGSWWLEMNYCEGTFSKKWRQELAKLSWEDFRNFNQGGAQYDQGYFVTKCDQEYEEIKKWYIEIIDYIKSQLRQKGLSTSSNSTSSSNNSTSSSSISNSNQDQTDYEEELKKLKSLFDKDLITQDEYDAKRKEILDAM